MRQQRAGNNASSATRSLAGLGDGSFRNVPAAANHISDVHLNILRLDASHRNPAVSLHERNVFLGVNAPPPTPPPRFAECACAPWISRAGIGKGNAYTTPAVARRGFLRASLKLVFLPERLNGARRDGQAGAGQRCASLGPMALEAPATARRDARAT